MIFSYRIIMNIISVHVCIMYLGDKKTFCVNTCTHLLLLERQTANHFSFVY